MITQVPCLRTLLKWAEQEDFGNQDHISKEQVNYYQEYLGTQEEQAAEQAKPDSDTENGNLRRVPKRG